MALAPYPPDASNQVSRSINTQDGEWLDRTYAFTGCY
jgi:hypothetical protein